MIIIEQEIIINGMKIQAADVLFELVKKNH